VTGLLDTNIALYLLGRRLKAPLPSGDYGVSVITEMFCRIYRACKEAFSWTGKGHFFERLKSGAPDGVHDD